MAHGDRPNLMVKIPGTREGIPAIEQMIAEGLSINVTLLFAVSMYEQVMQAYLTGLERRVAEGKPIDRSTRSPASSSVASTPWWTRSLRPGSRRRPTQPSSSGYGAARQGGHRQCEAGLPGVQARVRGRPLGGARVEGRQLQRPLWASTSTKNPAYSDTLYIAGLVGPPRSTRFPRTRCWPLPTTALCAATRSRKIIEGARRVVEQLAEAGVDLQDVTERR